MVNFVCKVSSRNVGKCLFSNLFILSDLLHMKFNNFWKVINLIITLESKYIILNVNTWNHFLNSFFFCVFCFLGIALYSVSKSPKWVEFWWNRRGATIENNVSNYNNFIHTRLHTHTYTITFFTSPIMSSIIAPLGCKWPLG